jgi:hypothetical protein
MRVLAIDSGAAAAAWLAGPRARNVKVEVLDGQQRRVVNVCASVDAAAAAYREPAVGCDGREAAPQRGSGDAEVVGEVTLGFTIPQSKSSSSSRTAARCSTVRVPAKRRAGSRCSVQLLIRWPSVMDRFIPPVRTTA